MDIKKFLDVYKIKPDPLKDQFFLTDQEIIKKIVEFANLNKNDVVLEIGAGTGALTEEIARRAGRVITFEIDKRLRPFLDKLPKNVEVYYENAWKYIQFRGKFRKKEKYNKVIANPPYSFIEPFLRKLTFLDCDKVILVVPLKFFKKGGKWAIIDSFFKVKTLLKIAKEKFYPTPKTNSAVIDLIRLPDPIKNKNLGLFLRQYIYQHEGQLVKNSLMEGIIKYAKLVYSKKVTKNQARRMLEKQISTKDILERHPDKASIYEIIGKSFEDTLEFWNVE